MNKGNYEIKPAVFEQIVSTLKDSRELALEHNNVKLVGKISKLGSRLHIIAKAKAVNRGPGIKKRFLNWLAFRFPGVYWLFWANFLDDLD